MINPAREIENLRALVRLGGQEMQSADGRCRRFLLAFARYQQAVERQDERAKEKIIQGFECDLSTSEMAMWHEAKLRAIDSSVPRI